MTACPFPRPRFPARLLLAAIAAIAALCLVAPPGALAQEAERITPQGCAVLGDMVLTARALQVEKVERDLAGRIMARIYAAYATTELAAKLIDRATSLGYGRTESPQELGVAVYLACMKTDGDAGATLGAQTRLRLAPHGIRT